VEVIKQKGSALLEPTTSFKLQWFVIKRANKKRMKQMVKLYRWIYIGISYLETW